MEENIINKIENFDRALFSVNELLTYPNPIDGVVKTGFAQRFNLAFELAIKLLRSMLIDSGEIFDDIKGSKDTIRSSAQMGYIQNSDQWFEMIKDRNVIAHEYNEMKIDEIYVRIETIYLQELNFLSEFANKKYASTN
jgi:nucleotidyltransferase substrate binding protein (TIGR01987 family)